ncbi:hypothetical protein FISHEDRAFT_35837, partial [Fistulina hepatica ATCC 64428]
DSFYGHTHNHLCQLLNHPLFYVVLGIEDLVTCEYFFSSLNGVSTTIYYVSSYHWMQFIDLHM